MSQIYLHIIVPLITQLLIAHTYMVQVYVLIGTPCVLHKRLLGYMQC